MQQHNAVAFFVPNKKVPTCVHFVSWRKTALPSPPTPMMSSKTTFPHRIGGSHHKCPPSPPPPTPALLHHHHLIPAPGQSLLSFLKNRRFSNFFPLLHQPYRKPQRSLPDLFYYYFLILFLAFFAREEKKTPPCCDHGNGEEENQIPAAGAG